MTTFYHISCIILMFTHVSLGQGQQDIEQRRASHPHHPDDKTHTDEAYVEPELKAKNGVKALTQQAKWLSHQLQMFPEPATKTNYLKDKYGAIFNIPEEKTNATNGTWIELDLNLNHDIICESIALVPAIFAELSTTENYAFPKRFKIEGFKFANPDTPIVIADWTKEDFPDPGLSPVIFNSPELLIKRIRITVYKGLKVKNKHFFALDEILIFRHGLNIAPPIVRRLKTSSQLDYPPYWRLAHLMDGRSHLGSSLGAKERLTRKLKKDFTLSYSPEISEHDRSSTASTTITIDLGANVSIGRIELYTAYDPDLPIPNLPLPLQYEIELLESLDPEIVVKSLNVRTFGHQPIRYHPFYSSSGRYVRFTFTKLPVYNFRPILALGEIRIIGDDATQQEFLKQRKDITLTSTHPEYIEQYSDKATIVDFMSNGYPIVLEQTFMERLAKRALVEKAHDKVLRELAIARETRSRTSLILYISLAAIALIVTILLFNRMRYQKRREIRSIQKQISADLHDDISGNLGTIAMISNRIMKLSKQPKVIEKLQEIEHLSKESYMSVKEIIWHSDSATVCFRELINQIKRTAESTSNNCQITYNLLSENSPYMDLEVPVSMRRNIILLVKESLFNCAKYAKAKNLLIKVDIVPCSFQLTMKDDGCGFDLLQDIDTSNLSGSGLINMRERANLLGADLQIDSKVGEGTTIKLTMPIENA